MEGSDGLRRLPCMNRGIMAQENHCIALNNDVMIPQIGFGVFQVEDGPQTVDAVRTALEDGYRHIDTASVYGNEASVGKAIAESDVDRADLFVTTKLWNDDIRKRRTKDAFQESLDRLGLDYVDLYLIHWPVPGCFGNTWKVMEKLRADGKAKSIGVSNFSIADLELLKTVSDVVPAVNQVEFHPLFNHPELKAYCEERGIVLQAYAPLARGAYLKSPLMLEIGKTHEKTPAQVGLRWLVQQGISVIPKSVHKERLEENSQIFDFALSDEEMAAITAMDAQQRVAGVPDDMMPYIL